MMNNNSENLIDLVQSLIVSEKESRSSVYDDFNIFTITKRERFEESTHCRFIFELLSPGGSHKQGDFFLQMFFEIVLGKPYPDRAPNVYRELSIDNDSRIDLCISGDGFCFPIEVKVDADEQPSQLERYCKWAEAQANDSSVYFLTLDGHLGHSAGSYEEMVIPISFETHIMDWIIACCNSISDTPHLYEPLHQYCVLLQRITGRRESRITEQIERKISSSAAAFDAAQAIADSLENVKCAMLKRVMGDIESHLSYLQPVLHKNYATRARDYYRTNPYHIGVSFPLRSYGAYHLALRVQISEVLYFGLALYKGNGRLPIAAEKSMVENARALTPRKHENATNWFYWWEPLTYQEERIDFRNCTGCYTKLYEPQEYDLMIAEFLRQIDDVLNEIMGRG